MFKFENFLSIVKWGYGVDGVKKTEFDHNYNFQKLYGFSSTLKYIRGPIHAGYLNQLQFELKSKHLERKIKNQIKQIFFGANI